MISRRNVVQLATTAVLIGPKQSFGSENLDAIYQVAKKESQVTWYSGFLNQEICARIGNAFTKKWPGITVSATKTTSQVAFQRLLQDLKGGQVQADIFSSTDPSHMAYLRQKKLLMRFDAPSAAGLLPALKDPESDGYYYPGWIGVGALGYNSKKVAAQDAPKDWSDLIDSKWKDGITFGSPVYSGVVGSWVVAMQNLYGWEYFEKLNALAPLIGRSFDDSITVLNSGERVVGLVNIAAVARTAEKGNPIAFNSPRSGTLVVPSSTAVVQGCKSPNAGKLFLDFTCGPEYSAILADEFEIPMRADTPPKGGIRSLGDVKTLTPTLKEIQAMLPESIIRWKNTFS